jgi:hypothetical protein
MRAWRSSVRRVRPFAETLPDWRTETAEAVWTDAWSADVETGAPLTVNVTVPRETPDPVVWFHVRPGSAAIANVATPAVVVVHVTPLGPDVSHDAISPLLDGYVIEAVPDVTLMPGAGLRTMSAANLLA